jgi:hypothetical protein
LRPQRNDRSCRLERHLYLFHLTASGCDGDRRDGAAIGDVVVGRAVLRTIAGLLRDANGGCVNIHILFGIALGGSECRDEAAVVDRVGGRQRVSRILVDADC